ncbi:hypothetical protein F1880_007560 [Penicillium rolfsii]|nr:hypothetical protein F1880_007560 [Penicillium rolfsii]
MLLAFSHIYLPIYPELTILNRIPGRPHSPLPVNVTEFRKCAVASPKLARFPAPGLNAGEDHGVVRTKLGY